MGRPPKQTSLFWRETRQRIVGHEISPYPEVVKGCEWELTTRPSRGRLAAGKQRAVGGWTAERAVGGWTAERAVGGWTVERRTAERLAWIHGQGRSTPDTGAERRGSMG